MAPDMGSIVCICSTSNVTIMHDVVRAHAFAALSTSDEGNGYATYVDNASVIGIHINKTHPPPDNRSTGGDQT